MLIILDTIYMHTVLIHPLKAVATMKILETDFHRTSTQLSKDEPGYQLWLCILLGLLSIPIKCIDKEKKLLGGLQDRYRLAIKVP